MKKSTHDLKVHFESLAEKINDVDLILKKFSEKINNLSNVNKNLYDNNKNKIFIFGLDTFQFQTKLLLIEKNNFEDFNKIIINRTYYDYIKISIIIIDYIQGSINNKKINTYIDILQNYPEYDHLNIKKIYDIETIHNLYNDIINVINLLDEKVINDRTQLSKYQNDLNIGLNINNFVYSYEANIFETENKIKLFINSLEYYIQSHISYFERLYSKIMIAYSYLNKDITIDKYLKNNSKNIVNNIEPNLRNLIIKDLDSSDDLSDLSDLSENLNTINLNNTDLETNIKNSENYIFKKGTDDNIIVNDSIVNETIVNNSIVNDTKVNDSIVNDNTSNRIKKEGKWIDEK